MAGGFLIRQGTEEAALKNGELFRSVHGLPDLAINDDYWITLETTTKDIHLRELEVASESEPLLVYIYSADQVVVTIEGDLLPKYNLNTRPEFASKTSTANAYVGGDITVGLGEIARDTFIVPASSHLAVIATGRIAGANQKWYVLISNTADKAQDATGAIVRLRWEDLDVN